MAYSINGKDHFSTKLWTGTGAENAITGVGFRPDFVWIKQRDYTRNHNLFDIVRGVTKRIYSDDTSPEDTVAQTLKSFDSDGFTLGTDTSNNANTGTYLAHNWKAGNSQGSANTDGSINTTYTSVNTTAGFSISQYTGTGSNATIGHGLTKPPKMIIIKSTTHSEQWVIGHSNMDDNTADSWDYYINFTSGVREDASDRWQDTLPTSSVFSLGTESQVNGSGKTYIAYCWSEIPGYSRFGMYFGNASTDGPMVNCGFKPAWVLVRNVSATNNWFVQDSKRLGRNFNNHLTKPNSNGADDTGCHIDILSNGFKVRSSSANNNGSGNYMIYAAFAEAPLVGSNNIPCNAR